jgi:hypothetical protein
MPDCLPCPHGLSLCRSAHDRYMAGSSGSVEQRMTVCFMHCGGLPCPHDLSLCRSAHDRYMAGSSGPVEQRMTVCFMHCAGQGIIFHVGSMTQGHIKHIMLIACEVWYRDEHRCHCCSILAFWHDCSMELVQNTLHGFACGPRGAGHIQ